VFKNEAHASFFGHNFLGSSNVVVMFIFCLFV